MKAKLALPEPDPTDELRAPSGRQVEQLLSIDPTNDDARTTARDAVDRWVENCRRDRPPEPDAAGPLKEICHGTEDGGEVAKSLSDLRIEVEKLDPSGLDTDAGWFTRLIGKIPGVGTPLKRYSCATRARRPRSTRSSSRSRRAAISSSVTT